MAENKLIWNKTQVESGMINFIGLEVIWMGNYDKLMSKRKKIFVASVSTQKS
jgi:hypothetical protein